MKVKIYDFNGREPEKWENLTADSRIKNIYEISTYGRIRNKNGKILRADIDKDGYIRYTLQGHRKKVHAYAHRLVGLQFIPNPDNKPEINHIFVSRSSGEQGFAFHDDNYYHNLEWATRKENIIHSRKNILQPKKYCEAAANAKVDNDTVQMICLFLEEGLTNVEIRRKLGISRKDKKKDEQYRGLIKHIKSRKHWTQVSQFYNF